MKWPLSLQLASPHTHIQIQNYAAHTHICTGLEKHNNNIIEESCFSPLFTRPSVFFSLDPASFSEAILLPFKLSNTFHPRVIGHFSFIFKLYTRTEQYFLFAWSGVKTRKNAFHDHSLRTCQMVFSHKFSVFVWSAHGGRVGETSGYIIISHLFMELPFVKNNNKVQYLYSDALLHPSTNIFVQFKKWETRLKSFLVISQTKTAIKIRI